MVADHVELEHCRRVDERYRTAFDYGQLDVPILVVQSASMFGSADVLPAPWSSFHYYSYAEAFYDPAAMMQNQLLDRVVPGILLKDDNPLSIRNNNGTIQIASIFGARWGIHEDNFPWVEPFEEKSRLQRIADSTVPVTKESGVLSLSFKILGFYREKLAQFPPLADAIQISIPDLQGPMDVAEQLWGSDIYYAFYDQRPLLDKLLSRIVDVIIGVARWFREISTDRLSPRITTQHGYMIPGQLLLRNDSSLVLSPGMYEEVVRPHDIRLAQAMGIVSLHSCGKWDHLVAPIIEIPGLRGLDTGNPEMMDIKGNLSKMPREGHCADQSPSFSRGPHAGRRRARVSDGGGIRLPVDRLSRRSSCRSAHYGKAQRRARS